MKKVYEFIKSNIRQIIEILILIVVIIIPFSFDFKNMFKEYLENNHLSPDNFAWYTAISHGGYIASVLLLFIILPIIWKFNENFVMNRKRIYHDYCYAWYWCCAKILRIKKCDLVLVPIYMQFKLAINGTFDDYALDDRDYPIIENEPECKITKSNMNADVDEINLILEDTYIIENYQIPDAKRELFTIKISRNDGKDNGRHYSEKLIDATINQVRKLNRIPVMNVFASTNPLNTENIAKRVFALGDRGNIVHLYVFQQNKTGNRLFKTRGYKIY